MPRSRSSNAQDWMEMIRIRLDHAMARGLEDQIRAHLHQIQQNQDAPRVIVRRHLSVSNDLMIVLLWDTNPKAAGSSLAYSLCREYEVHGLVDHTVWSAACFTRESRTRKAVTFPLSQSTSKENGP